MIQRKLVFCIDNNINFVSGSIPATKLTANDINRDVIYVVAPFEISSVIKVKFADELNQQENVSQLLKYTNEVSVDELVEKTKPYYETVKDWNVYYIEMNGKPLSFVSNRISTGIYISFSVVITKPKTNLVSGLNFIGYEYGESLENPLNNGEYKIIRNPLFEEDGVSYNVDDIIYKENDNYFRVSASIRKGGTTGVKYLVEPNVSAIDESLDPTLTEQIIEMVTDLEQDVAHISRNAILKDGSVAMEDDLDLGGNDLVNVNEVKVDRISANGGSYIEVINDVNVSGNDIGNVANIETNSAYTQRLKVDIIENYNSDTTNVETDLSFETGRVLGVDKVYLKELHARGGSVIEVLDDIDMNGEGIYGVGEVEGEIGTFNNSLTKGGKEVATEEYVDQEFSSLDLSKLNKEFSSLIEEVSLSLSDVFVVDKGSGTRKVSLGTIASFLNTQELELFTIVDELPTENQNPNTIYLLVTENEDGENQLLEYIWIENQERWELIGSLEVDLSDYYTKTEVNGLLGDKVDKVSGKGLSTNDYTDEDKQNVEKIPTIEQDIVDLGNDKVDKNNAITAGTHPKITYDAKGLVTGGSDLVATDIPNLDAGKITTGTFGVDRIPNLNASKINAGTLGADRIPTLAPSKITQDANNRFVTDTEKSTWNSKQSALGFTPENQANKKTTLTDSDVDFPTTKAVKTAIDTAVSQTLKPMGNWNASTNTPTLLATDIDRANQVWYVNVAGTQFGIEFDVNDELVYNTNGVIFKRDNVDAVISVNGKEGVVVLTQDDVADGSTYKRVTETEKTTWNNKQNALTAGDGISISGNVISADGVITVETWNTVNKTLELSDSNKLIACTATDTTDQTLTIPTNASVPFPIGTMITFLLFSKSVTFVASSGVTLTSMDSLVELATKYSMASLIKTDTDFWQLVGALE